MRNSKLRETRLVFITVLVVIGLGLLGKLVFSEISASINLLSQEAQIAEVLRINKLLFLTLSIVIFSLLLAIYRLVNQIKVKDKVLLENKTFTDIINFSSDAILILDINYKIDYCNKATEELFGFSLEDLKGKDPDIQFKTFASTDEIAERKKAIHRYGFWMGELKRRNANGDIIELHLALNSFKNLKGNTIGYFAILSDITKLINAQERIKALAESLSLANLQLQEQVASQTALIKDVFERVREVFIGTDSNFKINYVSKHIDKIFGISAAALNGKDVNEFLLNVAGIEHAEIPFSAYASTQNTSFKFFHKDTGYWFEANVYPSRNGVSINFKDITEKIKSEAEILKSHRMYEFISKANECILISKTPDILFSSICEIAVSFEDILFCWIGTPDKSTDKMIAISWAGLEQGYLNIIKSISTLDLPEGRGPSGKAFREGHYYYSNDIATDPVMELWRKEALSRGFHSAIAIPIKVNEKVTYLFTLYTSKAYFFTQEQISLLVNITENISFALQAFYVADLKKASDMQLQKVLKAIEQSSASIVISDVMGNMEYVNPAFCKLTGYTLEEAIGQNPRILKTGLTANSEYVNLWDKLTRQSEWSGEFCNKKKNGELYWEFAVISPVLNELGEVTNYVAVKENITARKALEEDQKRLTNDIIKRNQDLEQFSYILSHNIRGPLSNILGLKEALMRDSSKGLEPSLIEAISSSAEKMDQVIREVTQVIHQGKLSFEEKKKLEFVAVLNAVKADIGNFIEEKQATIVTDFSAIATIYSLESYLNSIFYQLTVNALKFSKPDLPPKIQIWTESKPDKVVIHFKDYGIGLDLNRYGKSVFGLYKKFNLNIEGRGIGLFLVKSQIDFLGGEVEVRSELNQWTEFVISLPNENGRSLNS
jgi:PAS domain S-box-containing protein